MSTEGRGEQRERAERRGEERGRFVGVIEGLWTVARAAATGRLGVLRRAARPVGGAAAASTGRRIAQCCSGERRRRGGAGEKQAVLRAARSGRRSGRRTPCCACAPWWPSSLSDVEAALEAGVVGLVAWSVRLPRLRGPLWQLNARRSSSEPTTAATRSSPSRSSPRDHERMNRARITRSALALLIFAGSLQTTPATLQNGGKKGQTVVSLTAGGPVGR